MSLAALDPTAVGRIVNRPFNSASIAHLGFFSRFIVIAIQYGRCAVSIQTTGVYTVEGIWTQPQQDFPYYTPEKSPTTPDDVTFCAADHVVDHVADHVVVSACWCIPVSYTHLTLPTKRIV